jgi:putative tricarboxylic transport membrane protein
MIPLLTLGIPTGPVLAILLGAMMMHGVGVGPMLIKESPDLFWGVITSMYVGNAMLLVLNLPLIGLWVQILRVPYSILFALIFLFCLIGVYTIGNNTGDMVVMIVFGIIGYLMRKYKYDAPPLVLAFVLCPIMEQSLRRSLLMSDGNPMIFLQRPISVITIAFIVFLLVVPVIPGLGKKRDKIAIDEEG